MEIQPSARLISRFFWLCLSIAHIFSNIMNNNLQNPLKVLKAKIKEAWSGCIEIEEPQDASVGWNVYLLEGKVQYINSTVGQQERLNYLWQRFKLGSKCPQLDTKEASEYVQLCQALFDKQLSELNIKKLLFMFTREGLVNVLSISQKTKIKLKPAKRIKKTVISFSLEKLAAKQEKQIRNWIEIRSYLSSSFSRLYVEQKNALKFYKVWKSKYATPEFEATAKNRKLSSFVSLFVARSSLYQIATKANIDTYFLAHHLQQSIAEGTLELHPFQELASEGIEPAPKLDSDNQSQAEQSLSKNSNTDLSSALIVCVDDSKTVQKQVKMTLEAGGYRVLGILDPQVAIKQLARHQPAVILLDINMPNLNGYELCSLLRKSQKFKEIPIVMLTGRDGMIDRVRAKLVGATDYLTKPCDPNKLIALTKALEKSAISV